MEWNFCNSCAISRDDAEPSDSVAEYDAQDASLAPGKKQVEAMCADDESIGQINRIGAFTSEVRAQETEREATSSVRFQETQIEATSDVHAQKTQFEAEVEGPKDAEEPEPTFENADADDDVVDKLIDAYDPITHHITVRDRSTKIVHTRPPRPEETEPRTRNSRFPDDKMKEAVTNWGVLVARASWCSTGGHSKSGSRAKFGLITSAFEDAASFAEEAPDLDELLPAPEVERKAMLSRASARRRLTMAERRAKAVVGQMRALMQRVSEESDVFDADWKVDSLSILFSSDAQDTLMILANGARLLLETQDTMVQIDLPCKVFGDTHGHLRDVLMFFSIYGTPGADPNLHFVFNGDFVDRGHHQLEVVGLLFALKVLMPNRVWLVRGNHEELKMNKRYGFFDHCTRRLGDSFGAKTFDLFQKAFDMLPLACLIDTRILVVHGGVGDGKWNVNDLLSIKRPLTSDDIHMEGHNHIFNILWSDPIEDDDARETDTFGVHDSPRDTKAARFGWNVTKTFCALNGLRLVIRSHQCKKQGMGYDVMHDNMLVRVFSARDYEHHANDSAILSIKSVEDGSERGRLCIRPQVLKSKEKAFNNLK